LTKWQTLGYNANNIERLRKEEYAAITGQRAPVAEKGYGENGRTWSWSRIVDK